MLDFRKLLQLPRRVFTSATKPKSQDLVRGRPVARGRAKSPRDGANPLSKTSSNTSGTTDRDTYTNAGKGAERTSSANSRSSSRSRSTSPVWHEAAFKALGKTARALQKVADYGSPKDVDGSKEAARKQYPVLSHVLHRYAQHKDDQTPEVVVAVAARLVQEDAARFDRNDAALAPLMNKSKATDEQFENFKGLDDLRQDLVGLKERKVRELAAPEGKGPVLTQRFGHMTQNPRHNTFSLVPNQTLSSDAIKKDFDVKNGFMRQYNANLGSIKDGDKLVFVRSARTDSAKKLEELLLFGASEKTGNAPYRPAIISAMDLSVEKDLATRLHGENEVDLLRAQGRAVEDLFGKEDAIQRKLSDGRVVTLMRPVLLNAVLSGQAKHAHNIHGSRRYNEAGLMTLGQELAGVWKKAHRPT